MDQDETWHVGRPRPGHIVLDGDPAPPPKRRQIPQFSAHVYCGQTVGWIKVPLGTEVGLGPGDIVLYKNLAPAPQKGGQPQIFGPCLLWPNVWMNQDDTWYGGRPQLRRHCVRWGPSSPPLKGTAPPTFGSCPLWPNHWMD